MASLIWSSIFILLCIEIVITIILVVPVPRKIRNYIAREIFQFSLGDKLTKPLIFIGVALGMALVESYFTHERIVQRLREEEYNIAGGGYGDHHVHSHSHHPHHFHDRERKYKTERNMYLTGFALTLLFVIGRITQLMQESVELESDIDALKASDETKVNSTEGKKQPVGDKKKD